VLMEYHPRWSLYSEEIMKGLFNPTAEQIQRPKAEQYNERAY